MINLIDVFVGMGLFGFKLLSMEKKCSWCDGLILFILMVSFCVVLLGLVLMIFKCSDCSWVCLVGVNCWKFLMVC